MVGEREEKNELCRGKNELSMEKHEVPRGKNSHNEGEGEEREDLVEEQTENDNILEKKRGEWSNPLDFFISCLGYAVGLGNVWRFPFLCFQHGGGTFLLPYLIMLIFAGLPVFLLEVGLGQYASVGPIKTFERMAPLAGGLGIAVVCVSLFLAFFYNVVVSWSIWYLVATFTGMEWTNCGHEYNSLTCWSPEDSRRCEKRGKIWWHGACTNVTAVCGDQQKGNWVYLKDQDSCSNGTSLISLETLVPKSSSVVEYYERNVLGMKNGDTISGWDNFGYPRPESVLALGCAWMLVAVCMIKGVKSSGKVIYFTSLFPYFVLILLATRSVTLPGAIDGIIVYISPDFSKIMDPTLWTDAATQVIFSLGPACGCVITLSSYNSFNRNCHKDTILIALSNSLTSIFSGLVVFSILGFMAKQVGKEVKDVVKSGPGLAFIVYPEVVSLIPGSQVWAALFFLMLITLALGSIFGAFETVLTALSDQWSDLRAYKSRTVLVVSASLFLLGLPFCCRGGIHMFTLFNASAPSWNLLLFALLEVVLVSWVYGADRFLDNFSEMEMELGPKTKAYWKFSWKYSTPAILAFLLILSWVNFGHVGYNGIPYPVWVQILGYIITGCTILALPVVAVSVLLATYKESSGPYISLFKPTPLWGPNQYTDKTQLMDSEGNTTISVQ